MPTATKSSKTNNVVVVASYDHTSINVKEAIKNVVVTTDDIHINGKTDKKEKGIENVVVVPNDESPNVEKEDEKQKKIDIGISLDKLSLGQNKKLLVIPLRGIIVHRANRGRRKTLPKNRQADFAYGNFLVYKRPYCKEFLEFCFERFHVGVWSAAREHNLQVVLDHVMGDMKSKLLFTWDQHQCTNTGFRCLDNKDKPLFLKQLNYLWRKKYPNLPWRDGEYSASNTLLITDPVKSLLNPPNNGIFPPSYDPRDKEDRFLGPNGELRKFLDGLSEAKDVPTYVKDHRIGEPPITPDHSDWGYYSKIIRAFEKKGTTARS